MSDLSKSWFQSKTILATLGNLLAILVTLGVITVADADTVQGLLDAGAAHLVALWNVAMGLAAIYGRIVATKTVTA